MPAHHDLLPIGEASSRTGLSVDTLRFYERRGLFPPPRRTPGGQRGFSPDDLEWIIICQRLRASGMPLPEIARYAALVRGGPGNEAERLELLKAHEGQVRSQMAVLHDALELISMKVAIYSEALTDGAASHLFVRADVDDAYLAERANEGRQPSEPA